MITHMQTLIFRRVVFLFCCFVSAGALEAEECPVDTLLVRFYEKAATLMGEGEYDSAQYYFDRVFSIPEVERSSVYPVLLNEQATLFIYVGEEEKAFEMKKRVLPYLPRVDDLEKHISVYNDLGILYRRKHMQDSAVYYYNKALDVALRYDDESWLAHLNMNLSVFYFNLKRYDDAEICIDRALAHALKTDDKYVTFCVWQVRASIKMEAGKTDEAGHSMREAWRLASEGEGNPEWQIRCTPGLFRFFGQKKQNDSIDYYLRLGNSLLEKLPETSIPVIGFIQARAKVYLEQGRYTEALNDFLWLRGRSTGTDFHTLFDAMAHCYHELGMHQKAFVYMDSARMWTDSLVVKNLAEQMAQFEARYHAQEQELKISRLQEQVLEKETEVLKVAVSLTVVLALVIVVLLAVRQKQKTAERRVERLKQEKELESARRYIEGLEVECRRFACELHDGIANELLGLQLKIEGASSGVSPLELSGEIGKLREEVRTISHELMPPEFELTGLDEILSRYAEAVSRNVGCKVVYHSEMEYGGDEIPSRTAYELYRIVQELTMNSVKHSNATTIEISLHSEASGRCRLQVTDDGQGMTGNSEEDHQGIGLRTVSERVKAIQGHLDFETSVGGSVFILTFNLCGDE